ncbi:MAG: queuosine precursor transporter, partial [Flavobacteriaceae bacterium]|nr:queuosine precursor transporter [Flavobacteriaceae bacterium]
VAGIFASFFSLGIVYVSKIVPATSWSVLDNDMFVLAFGNAPLAVLASMLAYLSAQFVDIHIYHFWKNLTKGRHLWLRNNFSTFSSQIIDTVSVIGLLCVFEILQWEQFWGLLLSGVLFKIFVAFLDTPLLYLFVWIFRKTFQLKVGEEIEL